jgi:xylulokinase
MTPHLLGLDAGTSSTKAVLVTPDGRVTAEASLRHAVDMPAPGHVEQDPDGVWWKEVAALCRQLAEREPRAWRGLVGVGMSAVGASVVPVDADGRVTHSAILYGVDTRAEREIAWLERRLGAAHIQRVTGRRLSSQAVGPKILWLRRHRPAAYRATTTFLSACGFLAFRLTGARTMDYFSAVATAPLFDIRRLAWDAAAAALIVPVSRLGRLAWPAEVVGTVTSEASAATGLPEGLPVVAGSSDAAAEALSVGVIRPGDAMLMLGSTLFIVAVTRRSRPDAVFWPALHCLPGIRTITAGTTAFGAAERWLLDVLARDETDRAALAAAADACPPGSDGLVMLPYLSGERSPIHDPHASGLFLGLTLRHGRGHLYRAMLEGTAFSLRHNLEALEARYGRVHRLVVAGGGTEVTLWLQIVADVLGRELILRRERIGAAYGAAYLAGLGSGVLEGTAPLRTQWAAERARVRPDGTRHRRYAEPYAVYRELYPPLRRPMHTLSRLRRRPPERSHSRGDNP